MTNKTSKGLSDDDIERIKRENRTDELLLSWALEDGIKEISLQSIREKFDPRLKVFLRFLYEHEVEI